MWAMSSGAVPQSLHAESLQSLACVLWMVYTMWVIAVRKAQTCPLWCMLGRFASRLAIRSSSLSLSVTSFPCYFCSLTSSRTLDSRCLLRRFFTLFPGITSPSSVTQTESGYLNCSCRPYSFAYTAASFVSAWCRTLLEVPYHLHSRISVLMYRLTAAFTFVSLYPVSMGRSPLPPLSCDRYNRDVEPQGCLPPFSTTIFRASLSI